MPGSTLAPTELFERFSRQRLLVLGDVMLDWFIWGNVSRISPEAPVPVVEVQRESRYPGGAANVARNLTPFGGAVELAGLHGSDANGKLLRETLVEAGIGTALCLEEPSLQTITKTRVVARQQQVVRIDRERSQPIDDRLADALVSNIRPLLPELDGIIVEDYGKGLVTPHLARALLDSIPAGGPLVTVDPKPGNPIDWRGATAVKPNRSEAFACAGTRDPNRDAGLPPLEDAPLLETGQLLLELWSCRQVLLTLGEQGMVVFSNEAPPVHLPAKAREVFDVSGAGDTAIALYTLGLCAGLAPREAAAISNLASSIVVGKLGTTPIEREELLESVTRHFPGGVPLVW